MVMKVLTSAEMRATDERTAVQFGVPLKALMESAGEAVAGFILRQYPDAARVMVLCGRGNNGGDGFVVARSLAGAGVELRVLLVGAAADVKGEAAEALASLKAATSEDIVESVSEEGAIDSFADALREADLLVDAIVGTGFKPPLRGVAARLRDLVAGLKVPVVAVDLPSGWDADSMEQKNEGAFRADAVVTFTSPKMAHMFGHLTERTFGPVVMAGIGSPAEAVESGTGLHWAGLAKSIAERARDVNSNKGKFGHVLVVGGSYGKAGAPGMAGLACLRTGAGLVTAAVPASIVDAVARVAPELMLSPLLESGVPLGEVAFGTVSVANLEKGRLQRILRGIKVVAIGPGLSTEGDVPEFVRDLVANCKLPMVVDADALNAFDSRASLLDGRGRTLVLTPHPGEMARLAGLTVKEVEADRAGLARRFATEHQVTLVLKGWRTLVAHPDGSVGVNTSGNPAMAKGGSGDILTGIVAGMLAQFPDRVAEAVEAAVYLHGLAADFAALEQDEHTILATDTVAHLSDAFRYRVQDEDGLTWLVGVRQHG